MKTTFDQRLAAWAAKHKELTLLEACVAAERQAGGDAVRLAMQAAALKRESDTMFDAAMSCLPTSAARKALAVPGGAGLRD
ncbi:MAG: hypothetical protein JWP22_3676 [Ramlibacter sp.]|jgi:hypothetical protein|nr:hypothetical protein [Ramlibacter sp.]MDB5915001.1 hypothetical protein [Ramlibacter sp.]